MIIQLVLASVLILLGALTTDLTELENAGLMLMYIGGMIAVIQFAIWIKKQEKQDEK